MGLLFSVLYLLGLLVWFGPGPHFLVLVVFLLPLANLAYLWRKGLSAARLLGHIALRSCGFGVTVFLLGVLAVSVLGQGQLGYGDELAFQGQNITAKGYLVLAREAASQALLGALAAFLAEMPLKRGRF